MIRRQLPASSPLAPGSLFAAGLVGTASPDSARAKLEDYLAERFSADAVWLTDSGTHALQGALARATSGPEALVALPAYSCYDLATAAVGADVRVGFYDIDPVTLVPDMDGVRALLQRGAEVVVAGSLYGFAMDWVALRDECRAAGAHLIEDSAQGLGGRWAGEEVGSFGDMTVLSFGRGKGWTGGGGGALLLRGDLAREADAPSAGGRGLKSWIMSFAQWTLSRPALFGIPSSIPALHVGQTIYKEPSLASGMDGIPAAVILRHAERARAEAAGRAARAASWARVLDTAPEVEVCRPVEGSTSGYLRLPVRAAPGIRARLDSPEGAGAGVAPGYPIALHRLEPVVPHLDVPVPELPGAEELAESLRTLPTHSMVQSRDLDTVGKILGTLGP